MVKKFSNPALLYAYTGCTSLIFMLPVIIPFYNHQLGLTFQDFLFAEAFFACVVIAMEVPSGYMSDRWSRKFTLSVASLFGMIGYTAIIMADGLVGVMIAQGILGVAVACNSGTISALMYDSLLENGNLKTYQKQEGRRHGIGLYCVGIGSICGGFLYALNPYAPFYVDIATLALAMGISILIKEPVRHRASAEIHPLKDIWDTAKYCLHGHKLLAATILTGVIIFGATKQMMWAQQPFFMLNAIDEKYFGMLMAIGFVAGGLSGQFGHMITARLSSFQVLGLMVLAMFAACWISALNIPYLSLAVLFTGAVIFGAGFPYFSELISSEVEQKRRATALSAMGFLISIAFIPLSLFIGAADEYFDIRYALAGLGLWVLCGGSLGLLVWKKYYNRGNNAIRGRAQQVHR